MKIPALNDHMSGFDSDPMNNDNGFARTVLYGIESIKDRTVIRCIRASVRSEAHLARRGSQDLNDIVTSMSRTQVMVNAY